MSIKNTILINIKIETIYTGAKDVNQKQKTKKT